jgi:hypothetical protein
VRPRLGGRRAGACDAWLAETLCPPRLAATIEAMADAQDPHDARDAIQEAARRTITDCCEAPRTPGSASPASRTKG